MLAFLPQISFAPNVHPALALLAAAAGVIVLGMAKSGFGGGVGIIAVPLFALAFGAERGNGILLPLLIAADILSVHHHWGTWDKRTLRILAPGTLLGIALGSAILFYIVRLLPTHTSLSATAARAASENMLALITGIISVLYVILDQIRQRFAAGWQFRPGAKSGFAAGAAVGVVSTLAHAAGPVAAIFLLQQNMPRQAFMGTTVIYFFAVNTIKLIPYIALALINPKSLGVGLVFLPLVPLGTYLGARLNRRMSDKVFKVIVLTVVFLGGIQLIWDSAARLAHAR